MRGKNPISKYLILSIIILAVGVPAAYAITITLGGDPVIINGILDLMNNRITNVGTPTVSTDAATKAYVDSAPSTDTLALLGCTNNQIAEFVGSVWTCVVNVDTDTVPWNSRIPQSTSLTTVDSAGSVGDYTSITIGTDGLPVISYRDLTNEDLKVVHCTNASCSTSTTTTVDSAGDVGFDTSITIGTDGLPVISYFDSTNTALKVVHCTNTFCSTFDTPTTVDSAGDVGEFTSITIGTDGLPVISYRDTTNLDLKVAHCTNTSCSTFDTPTAVDSAGFVGSNTSITIGTDGLPVISYLDIANLDLKVAHCTNTSCSTFDTPTTVDSAGNVGSDTSITIGTDGLPVISYRDVSNLDLKVAHCTNTSCSTFDTPTAVDSAGNVGLFTSITIGTDGLPVISYFDNTNGDLKVAKCTNPICLNNWIRR